MQFLFTNLMGLWIVLVFNWKPTLYHRASNLQWQVWLVGDWTLGSVWHTEEREEQHAECVNLHPRHERPISFQILVCFIHTMYRVTVRKRRVTVLQTFEREVLLVGNWAIHKVKRSHLTEHFIKTPITWLDEGRWSFYISGDLVHNYNSLTVARLFFFFFFYICLFVCASMCWCQRTACRSWFSPPQESRNQAEVISLGGILLGHLFGPLKFLKFLFNCQLDIV